MTTTIVFETHSTSLDNEKGLASGWFDVELSETGIRQAQELGQRYSGQSLDAILCSDLKRSYETAAIAFGSREGIIRDARLRECDYGDCTHWPNARIELEKPKRLHQAFPNGESYRQVVVRVRAVLDEIAAAYPGGTVLIIGHRATHHAIEHCTEGTSLEELIQRPWRWRPGWRYVL